MAKKKCMQAAQLSALMSAALMSAMQKAEVTTRASREHHAKSREQHESIATEPRRHRPDGARPGAASASEPKRRHKQQTKTPPKAELTPNCFWARRRRAERRKRAKRSEERSRRLRAASRVVATSETYKTATRAARAADKWRQSPEGDDDTGARQQPRAHFGGRAKRCGLQ